MNTIKIINKRIAHLAINPEYMSNIRIDELKILKNIVRDEKWKKIG